MGIGTDIAALYGRGLLDVAIINREIDETDRADRNDNRPGEDIRVLYREGRVWAALPDVKLDSERPVPLALFPAPCAWRQLAQERLQSAGRRWTVALQHKTPDNVRFGSKADIGTDRLNVRLTPKSGH